MDVITYPRVTIDDGLARQMAQHSDAHINLFHDYIALSYHIKSNVHGSHYLFVGIYSGEYKHFFNMISQNKRLWKNCIFVSVKQWPD